MREVQEFYADYIAVGPSLFSLNMRGYSEGNVSFDIYNYCMCSKQKSGSDSNKEFILSLSGTLLFFYVNCKYLRKNHHYYNLLLLINREERHVSLYLFSIALQFNLAIALLL